MEGLWLLIPAYNAGRHIGELLKKTAQYIPQQRTIVVDDGSVDETAEFAVTSGVEVLSHKPNRGKGFALKRGFEHLNSKGAEWIICIDADLQHDPAVLPDFINAARLNKYDLVIGKRVRRGSRMPLDRRFSNWITSLFLTLLTGTRIEDAQSGYRLIRTRILNGLELTANRYDFEIEYLLKSIKSGARIGWINIPVIYSGERSSIHRFRDTLRFLKIVFDCQFRS